MEADEQQERVAESNEARYQCRMPPSPFCDPKPTMARMRELYDVAEAVAKLLAGRSVTRAEACHVRRFAKRLFLDTSDGAK